MPKRSASSPRGVKAKSGSSARGNRETTEQFFKKARTSKLDLTNRVPEFKSESQEADWWYENQHIMDEMFEDAYPELFKKKKPGVPITIRLDPEILEGARKIASKRGIRYQTFLKNLIGTGVRSLELALCAPKPKLTKEEREWLDAKPVGRELI
jgi:predicted DNA binding CopG/RHH family protein